jgi:hypothetical protein
MKRTIVVMLYAFVPLLMMAQDETLSMINKIKMDSTFIYGEVTLKTQEEASSQAKEFLKTSIKEWIELKTQAPCRVTLNPLVAMADSFITKRAKMTRFFTYISKADLKAVLNRTGVNMGNKEIVQDTIPVQNHSAQNEKVVLDQILGIESFHQLKGVIQPLHAKGLIKGYGKYPTMKDPAKSYLIIYDPDGDIRAVLGKGTSSRKNLATGQDDSEHNYSGCGAIWFQLNY